MKKCNLTRFSTNFKYEVFFWMLPHWKRCGGPHVARGPVVGTLWLNQTTLMQSPIYTLRGLLCKQACGKIHKVQFWLLSEQVQSCLLWRVFIIHLRNFLSLGGVLTSVSCSIVVVNLQAYISLLERVFRECLTYVFFFTATDVPTVDYSEIMTYS